MTSNPNPPAVRERGSNGPVRMSDMKTVPEGEEEVKSPFDPLDELLNLDPNRPITDEVDMAPEFTGKWTVKAMSNDINAQLLERATYYKENPRTKEQIRELNSAEFTRLVVAFCTTKPNLQDPRLYQKHNVDRRTPDKLVSKILLPGQIDRLAGAIMRISGFRDDLVTVAKNSSKEEV